MHPRWVILQSILLDMLVAWVKINLNYNAVMLGQIQHLIDEEREKKQITRCLR